MLSYFAAWILKAGVPVSSRSGPAFNTVGEAGGGRSRRLRDHGCRYAPWIAACSGKCEDSFLVRAGPQADARKMRAANEQED